MGPDAPGLVLRPLLAIAQRLLETFAGGGRVAERYQRLSQVDVVVGQRPLDRRRREVVAPRLVEDLLVQSPSLCVILTGLLAIAFEIEGDVAEPQQHDAEIAARLIVIRLSVCDLFADVMALLVRQRRLLALSETNEEVAQLLGNRDASERGRARRLDFLADRDQRLLEQNDQLGAHFAHVGVGLDRQPFALQAVVEFSSELDHLLDRAVGGLLGADFILQRDAGFLIGADRLLPGHFGLFVGNDGLLPGLFGLAVGDEGLPFRLLGLLVGNPRQHRRCAGPNDHQPDDGRGHARDEGIAAAPSPQPFGTAYWPGLDRLAGQEPAQVLRQGAGAAIALAGFFLQTFETDRLQVARDAGLELGGRHRLVGADLLERIDDGCAAEGRPAGEQFVQDGAQ